MQLLQLSQVAFKHALDADDTLPQLAFRYGADAVAIKRFNNLINDGLLQHRHSVYIPGDSKGTFGMTYAAWSDTVICLSICQLYMAPGNSLCMVLAPWSFVRSSLLLSFCCPCLTPACAAALLPPPYPCC